MSRAELLQDLRRRIEKLERRPPAPTGPRLPPGPFYGGRRASSAAGWGTLYRSRVDRVGRIAPGDAARAPGGVAATLARLPPPPPRSLLDGLRVLDIETTGLSGGTGTLAFLVGVGRVDEDDGLVVEQLLLGSPADEEAFLGALAQRLAGATLLVTFNGRSFDVPLLRTRCVLCGIPPGPLAALPHLDLLPPARRLWRSRAGDCRLVTLEERVLGRRRPEDIPGAMAPVAYGEFLRHGERHLLDAIVEHNRDDVAGTAALLVVALRILADPLAWAEDAGELLGAAQHHAAVLGAAAALPLVIRALELARVPALRRRALVQLAALQRRLGAAPAAHVTWERYRSEFPRENRGHVEVAKHLEHRGRDLEGALAAALAAPHGGADDVRRRVERLRRRLDRRRTPS